MEHLHCIQEGGLTTKINAFATSTQSTPSQCATFESTVDVENSEKLGQQETFVPNLECERCP